MNTLIITFFAVLAVCSGEWQVKLQKSLLLWVIKLAAIFDIPKIHKYKIILLENMQLPI